MNTDLQRRMNWFRRASACAVVLIVAACGGGHGDDHQGASFTVSGTVRTPSGTPLPGANVDITVITLPGCGPINGRSFHGHTTTDASGNYTGSVEVESFWAACSSYDLEAVVGRSCVEDSRNTPCYISVQNPVHWNQRDTAPRVGVDLLADRTFRIFGTVMMTDGSIANGMLAALNPSVGLGGAVTNGKFVFPYVQPGIYTVSFPLTSCGTSFCGREFTWSPTEATVTITTEDVDVAFSATKK
jgi:hypothetical protein